MAEQWKVIHRFSDGVLVQNPITDYQNMGLSLCFKGNKLTCVEHDLDCDDKLEPHRVINISRERLELFWELLRYRRGISLPNICSVAQKVQTINGSPSKSAGSVGVASDILLCSSIFMPDPEVFSHAPPRLLVWLRLANDAFDSSDPAYSIRNYYMIWEDLHPDRNRKDWPAKANELRLTRHFVSHGGKLWKEVRDFIERNLGKRVERYDPTDKTQKQFVSLQCESARNLIEAELDKSL